ncbi:hypothetical protein ACQJBY_059529 [Aegilops geniculata]
MISPAPPPQTQASLPPCRRATSIAMAGHLLPPLRPHPTFSHRHGHPQAQPSSSQITARRRPIPPSPRDSAAPPRHPRAPLLPHSAIPERRHPTPRLRWISGEVTFSLQLT